MKASVSQPVVGSQHQRSGFSIRAKLMLCLGALFIAALFCGSQGVRGMGAIFRDLEELRGQQIAQSTFIAETHISLLAWNREILKHVLADTKGRMEEFEGEINEHSRLAFQRISALRRLPNIVPELRTVLDDVETDMRAIETVRAKIVTFSRKGAKHDARDLAKGELRARMDGLDRTLKKLSRFLQVEIDITLTEAEIRYREAVKRIIIIVASALVSALVLALWVSHSILKSVHSISHVAQSVDTYLRNDTLDPETFPNDRIVVRTKDEFALLASVLNQMLTSLKSNIERRVSVESEQLRLIADLQQALVKVKLLSGLLPICSACKKIRDDEGYWRQIEEFISKHSEAEFTHSFCPDCVKRLYPDAALPQS